MTQKKYFINLIVLLMIFGRLTSTEPLQKDKINKNLLLNTNMEENLSTPLASTNNDSLKLEKNENTLKDTTLKIISKDSLTVEVDSTKIDSTANKDSLDLSKRKEIFKNAFEMAKTRNVYDIINYVVSNSKPFMAINIFGDLQNALYWKRKDIDSAISFGQFGFEYAIIQSKKNKLFHPELSQKMITEATYISFDTASFCWDGWGEKDIKINSTLIFIGYQAAREHLKLVKELNMGDINLARSHWMLAGLYLSSKQFEKAIAHYDRSAYLAKRGGSISETLLAKAFEAMSKRLIEDSPELKNEYNFYLENLKKQEDGKFFSFYVETAFKVYQNN